MIKGRAPTQRASCPTRGLEDDEEFCLVKRILGKALAEVFTNAQQRLAKAMGNFCKAT